MVVVTKTGQEVQVKLRPPTPALLAEVLPIYAAAEEKMLASRRGARLIAQHPELAEQLLGGGQTLDAKTGLKVAKLLEDLFAVPAYDLVDEYAQLASLVVELPEGVEVDWREQSLDVLHSIYTLFRAYVR